MGQTGIVADVDAATPLAAASLAVGIHESQLQVKPWAGSAHTVEVTPRDGTFFGVFVVGPIAN
jgi:hypothetical protein